MTNFVYIAQSLDGYIADQNGGIDWLNEISNPENSDFGFSNFLNKIDAIVMGKNTFEKVQSFNLWPYTKKVYVASSSLATLPEYYKDKAELINETPKQINKTLKSKGISNLYIDGGSLIQSFLKENLIDEFIITTIPILLGGGISLFGELDGLLKLRLKKSEVLLNSLVKTHYIRER